MLLGGNIGLFWCSAAVAVAVVLVGWIVGRWKWRRVASRKEEIERLMMLASEEAARAELEASSGHGSYAEPVVGPGSPPPVQKLQYRCEVCFSPTATRCKQCKAVRYCSRKCQIFHWRQGHKDECHSVTTHQYIDLRVHSHLKDFNPDGIEISRDGIQVMLNNKPVKSYSNKQKFSNPILHVPGENDPEIATKADRKQIDMNVKSLHLSDEKYSPTFSTDVPVASDTNYKVGDKYDVLFSMEKPGLTTPKTGCTDVDEKSESPSSFDSEQHSLSKPSPSSDFWAGTIEPKKSSVKAPEFDDVKKPNSCNSSLSSPGRKTNVRVEMLGSEVNRIQTDESRPATSMPRKSTALPEVSEVCLKAKEPVLNCKLPGQNGLSSKKVAKPPSTNARHKLLSEEGHVPSEHGDNVSSLQSLSLKVVDHQVDGTNDVLDSLKCQQDYSSRRKSSVAHLSSIDSTKKTTTIPNAQSVANKKGTHEYASRSLEIGGYVRVATSGTNQLETTVVDKFRVSSFSKPTSLGAGSCIMGRYEGSFPYEYFVKLYNWNIVELRPCGLKNCGNSCYANAVLQCLAFTPPLTAYFLQGLHANKCRKKEWCFMCELEALIKKSKEGNYPLSPARLLSHMHHAASNLGNGREEDAHEFLRYAIDAMQLVCLKDAPVNMPNSLDNEDTTLLGLTFGGYLQSKIECMRCGGFSKQHERIMDLTIEIGGEIGSLEDALRHFTRSEILDGENKYRCDRCKSYEKAKKKLRVLEAPNVLTIALKRFQSGEFGKLNKSVKFPEFLNLATYMRGTSDKSPIYQLYGAVVHLDVKNATFTGHYVCYVKNNQGKWFKADDSLVQPVELEKVLSNDAYMLFYARCSPRAPKPIRSSLTPQDATRKPSKDPTTSKIKFHLPEPWDFSPSDLNKRTSTNGRKSSRSNSEDEERSSSLFSESGSHSTDSSNRESTSTDESVFDHRDMDSDNPSPPSSVSSPVRTRHSLLADLDRYSSNPKIDGDGFWARTSSSSSSKVNSCRTNETSNNGVYVRKSMR